MNRLNKIYTPKQLEIYRQTLSKDWFLLINHGAKRSGKTILNNDLFLQELLRIRKQADKEGVAHPMYILSGVTLTTIYQNVLKELSNRYGLSFSFDKYNNFYLFGVYVVQVGHGTIGGVGKIRGMTSYGAYINEASLANEEVFDEIKSRCSGYGARILCDTNPDHPEHWLLKDYIEKEDESILSFHFTLFDNTFLNERYRDNIIRTTPSGMFTERNIYGNWVSGEGVVYRDFNRNIHYLQEVDRENIVEYLVGVDWGYSHYGVMVVLGVTEEEEYILLEEHAKQFCEIDYWAEVAQKIKQRYGNIAFYCDSARSEYVARLVRDGILARYANKNVIEGIEDVAKMLKSNRFFVWESAAVRFREEIYNYIWDSNGNPKKENDDVLDAIRYAIHTRERNKMAKIQTFRHSL